MKKFLTYIILVTAFIVLNADFVMAQETVAEASASIKTEARQEDVFDYRVATLTKFLEKYNSPLTPYAPDFVYWADAYDLDWRMVPAITGVESTFGKRIPKNSYNAYGWANGEYSFTSWEDSIAHVNQVLKEKYVDNGATSVRAIARIYAPPSATWAGKVTYFMNKIDTLPVTYDI